MELYNNDRIDITSLLLVIGIILCRENVADTVRPKILTLIYDGTNQESMAWYYFFVFDR